MESPTSKTRTTPNLHPGVPCKPSAAHFTNFTEISYEKTRNSYDQCEVHEIPPEHPLVTGNGRKWAEMKGEIEK